MEKYLDEKKYWLCLGKNSHIGSLTFSEILSKNVPLKTIFGAKEAELLSYGFREKTIKEILKCQDFDPDRLLGDLDKRGIKFMTINDPEYPELLKEIYDPPAIIYYLGEIEKDSLNVGLVGSRKPTDYGQEVTHEFAYQLARNGITIVSGMAIGVDTIAHEAALEAGGKTIAVLGCGLDHLYPSRNVALAKNIIKSGAIITEFPLGTPPLRHNFPIRNRIISGLSRGVLVTEAAESSGSLITASSALEQNRDVYAVPGPIFNLNSRGPNNLLKMGAKAVTSSQDIFDDLNLDITASSKPMPIAESGEEELIIKFLTAAAAHIDAIIKNTEIPQQKVASVLTMMELSGKIKHTGGMVYKLNR